MRIDLPIPEPCLVVLVGAAGSGKSTFAARHFAAGEVLSSDVFRARLGRDEADQTVSRPAFAALHAALDRRLAAGLTTVVDATNVRADARRTLIRRATAAGVPAIAVVLDLPLADCQGNDLSRPVRHVPAVILERQWIALRAGLGEAPFAREGFAAVHRLTTRAAIDSVVLRRGGPGWPTLSPAAAPSRRMSNSPAHSRHTRPEEDVEGP